MQKQTALLINLLRYPFKVAPKVYMSSEREMESNKSTEEKSRNRARQERRRDIRRNFDHNKEDGSCEETHALFQLTLEPNW